MGDVSKGPERRDLLSGTVTFLITDIEGSTRLSQDYPVAMPALLSQHYEIPPRSIEAQNEVIFQIVGDSISVAFHLRIESITINARQWNRLRSIGTWRFSAQNWVKPSLTASPQKRVQ